MTRPTHRPATWFVTGTSRGLGLELVSQLLQRGDNVAATTRSADRLVSALGADVGAGRLLPPLEVDLRDEEAVTQVVRRTTDHFGSLDVVVNNAGYGFLAAVEETSSQDVRDMLDVQVVGAYNVLRAAVPVLRRQKSGHVVNVSSVLGLTAVAGWGALQRRQVRARGDQRGAGSRARRLRHPRHHRRARLLPDLLPDHGLAAAPPEATSDVPPRTPRHGPGPP